MTSRQRGAAILLAALVAGRVLDRFDLPFERRATHPPTSSLHPAPDRRTTAASPDAAASPDTALPVPAAATLAPVASDRDSAASAPIATAGDRRADEPDAAVAINRATVADLQRLPGIGPVLAARIVEARASGGPFRDLADLQRVRGIGPKSATRLAQRLRFD